MRELLFLTLMGFSFIAGSESLKKELPDDSIYQVKSKWIDQDGKPFQLSNLAGKPVAISMIYLTCRFSCPVTVAHMKDLEKMLNPKLKEDMQFVLVSFDSDRDTPEMMRKFAEKNKLSIPKWRFITSKNEQDIREISSLIDFKYKKTADGEFEHSFGIVALDSKGRILGSTIGTEMREKDLVVLFEKKE